MDFHKSRSCCLRRHYQEMKIIPPSKGGAGGCPVVNVALETRRTPPYAPLARGDFQRKIHAIVIACLVATILLPPLKRMGVVPGKVWIALALLLGVAFSAAWLRFRAVR